MGIVEWTGIWRSLHGWVGTGNRFSPFPGNAEEASQHRSCSGGHERFLVKTYANGETVREPIVRGPRRKRYPDRPYWHWTFDKTKKKEF